MVGTGIGVSDACVTEFNSMKGTKTCRFIVFTIENEQIVPTADGKGSRDATYDDFLSKIDKDTPAYAVYDFDFEFDGCKRDKILFISWIPDTAKVRSKMIYAASKEALKNKIGDGCIEVQATDLSEISHEAALNHCLQRCK